MDPKEEALSLRDNPLPPTGELVDDKFLPSRILAVQKEIRDIEAELKKEREHLQTLFDRAIELGIGQDEHAYIMVKETLSDRAIDSDLFKKEKPNQFKAAVDIEIAAETEKIQKAIDKLKATEIDQNPKIRIKTLQVLEMSEEDITALSLPRRITKTYELYPSTMAVPNGKNLHLLTEADRCPKKE